uniref:ATP synthase F0 subunit 8 n=1 Tax=Prionospio plumosa TaxID=3050096 RepID=A0AAU6QG98_9ANNE
MPHLAPLAWALAPIIFWSILISVSASLWWTSTPSFPICVKSFGSNYFSPWKWN